METFYVVRVNGHKPGSLDTHAAETLKEALELAMPDDDDRVDYGTSSGAAHRAAQKAAQGE
jgi:hypothetical protein